MSHYWLHTRTCRRPCTSSTSWLIILHSNSRCAKVVCLLEMRTCVNLHMGVYGCHHHYWILHTASSAATGCVLKHLCRLAILSNCTARRKQALQLGNVAWHRLQVLCSGCCVVIAGVSHLHLHCNTVFGRDERHAHHVPGGRNVMECNNGVRAAHTLRILPACDRHVCLAARCYHPCQGILDSQPTPGHR